MSESIAPAAESAPAPTRATARMGEPPAPAPVDPVNPIDPAALNPPVTPPAVSHPLIDDNLTFRADWTQSLGEGSEGYQKTLAKFNSLADLGKSYALLEKNRQVPGSDAGEEAIASFRQANNIPADAQAYTESLTLPESGDFPPELLSKAVEELGMKHNFTPAQLSAAIAFEQEAGAMARQAQEQAAEAAIDAKFDVLEAKWKEEGKTTATEYGNAKAAAEMLNMDFADPDIGNNATLVQALANLSQRLDEDTLRQIAPAAATTSGEGGKGWMQKATDIVQNPSNPLYSAYHDPNDAQHENAHQRYDEYAAKATGFRE